MDLQFLDHIRKGAFGDISKVKWGDLVCVAKTLRKEVQNTDEVIARFIRECEVLSKLAHPKIVQYLGHKQDANGLLILLMELMDQSLTDYLLQSENSDPPYHILVNICQDIAQGLSFLHSKSITHRDLSSNNVLLTGALRAKISDLGMIRICSVAEEMGLIVPLDSRRGTDAYMPPDIQSSKKIDIFSYGVLIIQMLTRKIPKPSAKFIEDHKSTSTSGTKFVQVPEKQRRHNHISLIDENDQLLKVALQCIDDDPINRPSAHDICLAIEKLSEIYKSNQASLMLLLQQVQNLKDTVAQKIQQLTYEAAHKGQQVQQLQQKISSLQCKIMKMKLSSDEAWKSMTPAPEKMSRSADAVTDGNKVVVRVSTSKKLYTYESATDKWYPLPSCPYMRCSLAIINNELIAIGGMVSENCPCTDELLYLSETGNWKHYLHMLTARSRSTSITCSYGKSQLLVVIGGERHIRKALKTVEVLDISNKKWYSACDLPESRYSCSATVFNGFIYALGGWLERENPIRSVLRISIHDLVQSCIAPTKSSTWQHIAELPVIESTCTVFCDNLIVFGGTRDDYKADDKIRVYNESTKEWEVLGQMPRGRKEYLCFVAALDNERLLLIGGSIVSFVKSDKVDLYEQ